MENGTTYDRVRGLFGKSDNHADYAALENDANLLDDDNVRRPVFVLPSDEDDEDEDSKEIPPFSWFEYSIFLMLGIAMLWAW